MTDQAIRKLAELVERRVGHVVREDNLRFLADTVARRSAELGLEGVEAYVQRLANGGLPGEWERVLEEILVHESYLFRGARQLEVFSTELLPELVEARGARRRLRLWSAGCSRGEEAVTLALLLADRPDLRGWNWSVLATDVDPAALEAARRGIYGGRAIREVPQHTLERYFEPIGGGRFRVHRDLLARIEYRLVNLVREPLEPPGAPFDAIFLRNVLIYFRPESQRRVVDRMAQLLAPHGYLVAGPSESLWQISEAVAPVERSGVYFYRARSMGDTERAPASDTASRGAMERRSTARRRQRPGRLRLVPSPAEPPAQRAAVSPKGTPDSGPAPHLQPAVEALAGGRLEEALDLLEPFLGDSSNAAAAYALRGLAAELRGGNPREILAAYRRALFLEPRWFQIRLLLADLLWRAGERQRALGEYRRILGESGETVSFPYARILGLPTLEQAIHRARRRLKPPGGP